MAKELDITLTPTQNGVIVPDAAAKQELPLYNIESEQTLDLYPEPKMHQQNVVKISPAQKKEIKQEEVKKHNPRRVIRSSTGNLQPQVPFEGLKQVRRSADYNLSHSKLLDIKSSPLDNAGKPKPLSRSSSSRSIGGSKAPQPAHSGTPFKGKSSIPRNPRARTTSHDSATESNQPVRLRTTSGNNGGMKQTLRSRTVSGDATGRRSVTRGTSSNRSSSQPNVHSSPARHSNSTASTGVSPALSR